MKHLLIPLLLLSTSALADQYVHGYTNHNGTYVQPYHRSTPDNSSWNNYSRQGNVNPYNGNVGTQNPMFQQPNYNQQYNYNPNVNRNLYQRW